MEIDHQTLVAFSKSWGLFYLIALSIGVLIYTFWPANRKGFESARMTVLDTDDRPGS